MTVVTLEHYTPPEREDALPWIEAIIQESTDTPTATSWATIDTIMLAPVDADPANPRERAFTTTHATVADGWYRVIWQDAAARQSAPTPGVQNTSEVAGGVRPSVREVATHIRTRTKVRGGAELGTFNNVGPPNGTRPTASQVEDAIDDAIDEVLGKVQTPSTFADGDPLGPGGAYERRVRRAVALYAAISVELEFFPEQVGTGQSPATTMQARYESRIRALIAEGETGEAQGEGGGGAGGDAPGDPDWAFPEDNGGLIGWQSRW